MASVRGPTTICSHADGSYTGFTQHWEYFYFHTFALFFFICTIYSILVNVKLDISGYRVITFPDCRLHWSNGTAETKLVILAFLCCEEFLRKAVVPKTSLTSIQKDTLSQ